MIDIVATDSESRGSVRPGERSMPGARPSTRARLVVGLAAIFAWPVAASATPAPPQIQITLEYAAPPQEMGCPDAAEFRLSVERQLQYDPFRPDARRRVTVRIAPNATGFEGRITWSDAEGRVVGDRQLLSRRSDCHEIAASLAFSVAVQVQLLASLAPVAPSPGGTNLDRSPAAETERPPAPAVSPAPQEKAAGQAPVLPAAPPASPRPSPPAPERSLRLSAGVGPSLGLRLAPHPVGLGRIFVTGAVSRFSLELAVDGALPSRREEPSGSGFSLQRWAASTAGCAHAWMFAACGTATLGRVQARGFGVDQPASPAGLFVQVGGRISASRELGPRGFVAARVETLVMISSWRVTLNDAVTWTMPRVAAVVGVDCGVRFF